MNGPAADVYGELGVRPLINAAGAYTVLGGSALSPTVRAAMDDANRYFVEMEALLEGSGRTIAGLLGAEAALVTSGAAAALALSSAACLTRGEPERLEQLPDPLGKANEILIQRCLRQRYDRCVTLAGARLVEFGEAGGTSAAQLRKAINDRTVAIHFYVSSDEVVGALPIEGVIEVARERDVPLIVDAAGPIVPAGQSAQVRAYGRRSSVLRRQVL